jgi:PIN domain nuclease of toxin-antitoxin system
MRILLDTHALIWWIEGSTRLGKRAYDLLSSGGALISAVSIWEISIKSARGQMQLERHADEWIPELLEIGFEPLMITFHHAFAVRHLPLHHADPFDRMLIAQAQCEGLTLLTADVHFAAYRVPTLDAAK